MLVWFVTELIFLLKRPEGNEEDQHAEYCFTAWTGVTKSWWYIIEGTGILLSSSLRCVCTFPNTLLWNVYKIKILNENQSNKTMKKNLFPRNNIFCKNKGESGKIYNAAETMFLSYSELQWKTKNYQLRRQKRSRSCYAT